MKPGINTPILPITETKTTFLNEDLEQICLFCDIDPNVCHFPFHYHFTWGRHLKFFWYTPACSCLQMPDVGIIILVSIHIHAFWHFEHSNLWIHKFVYECLHMFTFFSMYIHACMHVFMDINSANYAYISQMPSFFCPDSIPTYMFHGDLTQGF